MRFRTCFVWRYLTVLLFIKTVRSVCSQNGKNYMVGQVWFPEGSSQCKQCRCDHGDSIVCRAVCKADRFPPDILIGNGQRSQSAENDARQPWKRLCNLEGKTYSDGTTWRETGPHSKGLQSDQCMECNCASQVVTCAIRSCPKTRCKNPVHHEGTCCKICPEKSSARPPRDSGRKGCTSIGRQFKDGYHWQLYLPSKNVFTACFSCICQNGKESCRKHVCQRPSCSRPVRKPGSCCASCKGEDHLSFIRGRVQENANSTSFRPIPIFKERSESSLSNPRPETLDLLSASGRAMHRKKVGKRDCMFGRNKVYKDNESFHPILEPFGRQKCTKCLCSNRMIKCGRIRCPSQYPCKNPQSKPNLCCKVCPGADDKVVHEYEKVQMYRTKGCTKSRKKPIQIYRYNYRYPEQLTSKKYLFDRSAFQNNKSSEIHKIVAVEGRLKVTRERISRFDISKTLLDSKWKYIGSVKEKVYAKFLAEELQLESCRDVRDCAKELGEVGQNLERRASRKRQCRSNSVVQSLQRLQEAG